MILNYDACPIHCAEYQKIRVSLPEPEPESDIDADAGALHDGNDNVNALMSLLSPEPSPATSPQKGDDDALEESFGSMDDDLESVPDFDRYVCVIQFAYRQHLRKRILAAIVIRRKWKRITVLHKWYEIVELAFERAEEAIQVMQRFVRCCTALERTKYIRQEIINKLTNSCDRAASAFVDDMSNFRAFLTHEAGNWEAFGLPQPDNIRFLDAKRKAAAADGVKSIHKMERKMNPHSSLDTSTIGTVDSEASSEAIQYMAEAKEAAAAAAAAVQAKIDEKNGVIMRATTHTQAQNTTIRAQMLRIAELPDPPSCCVHPLDEMYMITNAISPPWDVYSDAKLGLPVPYSEEERETATKEEGKQAVAASSVAARVHHVYNRMANKGMA